MPDAFLNLTAAEQQEALNIAATQTGRLANLLEKDVWVVQALDVLFSSEFGPHLVFKGGTALSKVHRVIERFSEDVDVTYDIRELAPDETAKAVKGLDVIPDNRTQQAKLTDLIRNERLPQWIESRILLVATRCGMVGGCGTIRRYHPCCVDCGLNAYLFQQSPHFEGGRAKSPRKRTTSC